MHSNRIPAPKALQPSTMVSAVTVLCLVAVLWEGAFSLTCSHCNTTVSYCEGNEKVCDNIYNTCITTLTEFRTDKGAAKPSAKFLVKSCGHKSDCNQVYSISLNGTYMYSSTKCCDTDKCKTENIELPKKDTKENEISCSSCNELGSKCNNPITIKCTGEETKCITYTAGNGTADIKFISQGCGSENVCSMKNVSALPYNQILMTPFVCSRSPHLPPALLFPIGLGFLMLKYLS